MTGVSARSNAPKAKAVTTVRRTRWGSTSSSECSPDESRLAAVAWRPRNPTVTTSRTFIQAASAP